MTWNTPDSKENNRVNKEDDMGSKRNIKKDEKPKQGGKVEGKEKGKGRSGV